MEFMVASLPDGIKDPAEFVEKYTTTSGGGRSSSGIGSNDIEEKFRDRVLDTAIEWTQWYANRIISSPDRACAPCRRSRPSASRGRAVLPSREGPRSTTRSASSIR